MVTGVKEMVTEEAEEVGAGEGSLSSLSGEKACTAWQSTGR